MISPLPQLVSLADAKAFCNITTSAEDQILFAILETAHDLCLDWLDNQIDDSSDEWLETILGWDETNAPRRVCHAILIQFNVMQRFRGDDDAKTMPVYETVSGLHPIAELLLARLRDPTVA